MEVIYPSKVRKEDLRKIKQLPTDLQREFWKNDIKVLWMPYHKVKCVLAEQGRRTYTTINASFPPAVIEPLDLLLLFRPNFLKKEKREVKQFPLEGFLRELPILSLSPKINAELVEEKITILLQSTKKQLKSSESRELKKLSENAGLKRLVGFPKDLKRDSYETKESHSKIRAIEILLKEMLKVRKLPLKVNFRVKDLFYYPYLLISDQGRKEKNASSSTQVRYYFVDLQKRGLIIKKLHLDPLLGGLLEKYSQIRDILHQA
ncbi:MAG: hypothetical protein GWN31_11020 [Candidatus Thorarchaeota archaeon]|nr:hypothetical protein [Candidatus Thorarchaeota archaeon]